MKSVAMFLCVFIISSLIIYPQTKTFTVDFNSSRGTIKDLNSINVGPDKSVQGYIYSGLKWVRTHDYYGPCDYNYYTKFYDTATRTFNPSFNPYNTADYSWSSSDSKMDSLVRFGLIPYFRLGYSYPQIGREYLVPIVPPFDPGYTTFYKFAGLCKATVMHYTAGWDGGYYYNIPYWEILNEPDNSTFWRGTPANLYNVYKTVADTLSAYNPNLKIGGPGVAPLTIVAHNKPYFDDFISFCRTNNVRLDFFSWHMYGMANPYCLKSYADTIRSVLDKYGFTNAESHITEINRELTANSPYNNSLKGAAYIASTLITAQDCSIDKYFWYRGTVLPGALFFDDIGTTPNLAWTAYSYKILNYLVTETPVKLTTTGNEVVEFNRDKDTTNLMILGGKSVGGDKVYAVISNFKSGYKQFDVILNNLPWNSSQTIEITKNALQTGSKFDETKTFVAGNSSLTVSITEVDSPSVYLLRLTPVQGIITGNVFYKNAGLTPVTSVTVKAVPLGGGTELTTTTNSSGAFTFSNVPNGTYSLIASTTRPWGGVNSTDALIVRQYIVGLKTFDSTQTKSANVNNSASINSTDAMLIRQRVVGIITSFTAGDWVFDNPSVTVNSNSVSANIYALCTGDVNGSLIPPPVSKSQQIPFKLNEERQLNTSPLIVK